jgi:fatty acid desaturase
VNLRADTIEATPSPSSPTTVDAPVRPLVVPANLRDIAIERNLVRAGGVRAVGHVVGIIAAWAALIVVGDDAGTIWVWIPVWICIAFLIIGLAGAGHDCVHATFVGHKRANTIAGHIVMSAIAIPFGTYRQFHLLHHADTLGPTDPEGPPGDFTSRLQYLLFHALLGVGFLGMIWWGTVGGALGRPPLWARTRHSRLALRRAWFPALPILATFAIASASSDAFRHVWLYPWLFVLVPVFPFVLLSEHYAGRAEDGIPNNTYTIRSNPVTRFAIFNINFHTAHHLIPRVPSAHLREFDRFVEPYESRRSTGYLAFHRSVVAPLPWRTEKRSSRREPHV